MIRLEHVTKTFKTKSGNVHAVKDVSIHVKKGMIYGIIGYSGAGKSTLVRCINLLEVPDSGKVIFDGKNLMDLSAAELREQRKKMSMIFQHFNLMSALNVYDNIALPMRMAKKSKQEIDQKVSELLDLIDLADRKDSYPSQLSGGQKQRVAIARALASDPKVLLCDESTSALDPQTTQSILRLIKRINEQYQLTVVIITHEMFVVKELCDRVAIMEEGRVIEKNDLVPLFTNPIQELTKNFIATTNNTGKVHELLEKNSELTRLEKDECLISISYTGETGREALISELSKYFNVDCRIVFGSAEVIKDQPVANLIVILKGTAKSRQEAFKWLEDKNVRVEVIADGSS